MSKLASSKHNDIVIVNKTGYEFKQYKINNKIVRMTNEVMNNNFNDKDYILYRWLIKGFSLRKYLMLIHKPNV